MTHLRESRFKIFLYLIFKKINILATHSHTNEKTSNYSLSMFYNNWNYYLKKEVNIIIHSTTEEFVTKNESKFMHCFAIIVRKEEHRK